MPREASPAERREPTAAIFRGLYTLCGPPGTRLDSAAFRVYCCATLNNRGGTTAKTFGETIREMRLAQEMGLRAAADRLGISPAYLSRVERGKERPPRPELVKRLAALLGGDSDLLFRLAESTDPDLAEYVRNNPTVPEFLRTARAMQLTADDFTALIADLKRRRSRETGRTNAE